VAEAGNLPRLDQRRVLITGGLGFIGSNLAHECVKLGAEVTIFDNLDPHSGGNLHNIDDIRGQITLVCGDLRDFVPVAEHIIGADVVFNCAASTSHQFSMSEPWADLDVNGKGMINLLEAARRFNPTVRLLHLGTSTQLGRLRYQPADEDHPEFPRDVYSANKSLSEKLVLIYAGSYGLRATVIRLSNVYGPRAAINNPRLTFNNYFIGLALQDREIQVFGDGRQLRNLTYVDDVSAALIRAALSDAVDGETFFGVGDHHHSVLEVAETIVRVMGTGRVKRTPWPPGRAAQEVGDAVLSNMKIKRVLAWTPCRTLEEGLRETKAFYQARLPQYL
jgi:UDP-glucose 4-epimerase